MKCDRSKWKVLHLECNNSSKQDGLGTKRLENTFGVRYLYGLVGKLNMSGHCALAAKKGPPHSELYYQQCYQQDQGGNSSLSSTGETTSIVLCPIWGSPMQEPLCHTGISSVECHQNVKYMMYRDSVRLLGSLIVLFCFPLRREVHEGNLTSV